MRMRDYWERFREAWLNRILPALKSGMKQFTPVLITEKLLRLANFRKPVFVNPVFQSRVILFGITISMGTLLVIYIAQQYFFYKNLQMLTEAGIPVGHPVYSFVNSQSGYMNFVFLIVSVIALLLSCAVGAVLSHRVAGPLHRLKNHLLETAQGRAPKPIQFRENDYFQELANAYNEELLSRGRSRRPGSAATRDGDLVDNSIGN